MGSVYNQFIKDMSALNKNLNANIISELVYGKIVTLNPLSINVNKRDTLPESFFFLGQMCRPHNVTISPVGGPKNDIPVELEIFPELKIGDTVVMISLNKGQKYYVLERIEE